MYQCIEPVIAVTNFTKKDGKKHLKFFGPNSVDYNLGKLRDRYGDKNVYTLGCGKCESCRKNYALDWSLRVSLECMYHPYNYFVTLTYADSSVRYANRQDLRKFLDRLEGKGDSKQKITYFACFELGELTQRPHWHIILMLDKPLELNHPVKIGSFMHYYSKDLDKKWKFGLHDISIVEDCATSRYVAKYTGKDSKIFMSRNIGLSYFLDNKQKIIDNGFKLYLKAFNDGKPIDIPKCFVRWFQNKIWCPEIDDWLFDKSNYGRTLAKIQQRQYNSVHEEVMLANKISRVKNKSKKVRELT